MKSKDRLRALILEVIIEVAQEAGNIPTEITYNDYETAAKELLKRIKE